MDIKKIDAQMIEYVRSREMVCGALLIRKNGEIIINETYGSLDAEGNQTVTEDTIFRMASMTKPLTAVAVMQLIEQGKLGLDDELARYIPEFGNMRVVADNRYAYSEDVIKKIPWMLLTLNPKKLVTVPAERGITIRDLLSHSSGLEEGLVGFILMLRMKYKDDTLETRALKYATHPLDFQPGTNAVYSPLASFDILARLVEIVSEKPFADHMQENIFISLGMKDAMFHPTPDQERRIPRLYLYKKGRLIDKTGSNKDVGGVARSGPHYSSGSGGLYATIRDYDRFVQMLVNEGELDGVRILSPETVRLMHSEAAFTHLEPQPGLVWGLGMSIRQDPEKAKSFARKDTYGWSGHFGTHFFISPEDRLSVVFLMNRAEIGGGNYISVKLEELVFE